jgi:methylase of polypeptide subunit release factors
LSGADATKALRSTLRVRFGGRLLMLEVPGGVHPFDPYAPVFAQAMKIRTGDRVLDLGCGAGFYGLAAAALGAESVVATDIDAKAVGTAVRNLRRNGFESVDGRAGAFFAPVRNERFDVIVTMMPQCPAPSPIMPSRYGGPFGNDLLVRVADEAPRQLRKGGRFYFCLTGLACPEATLKRFSNRMSLVRVAKIERAVRRSDYDALSPGLFDYLLSLVRRRISRMAPLGGGWHRLEVSFYEARMRD